MCKLCFTVAANTQRNRLNQAALLAEPQDKLCPTVAVNVTGPQAVHYKGHQDQEPVESEVVDMGLHRYSSCHIATDKDYSNGWS